jgi:hypothetical protein
VELVLPIILISILIAAIFLLLFLFLAVSGGSQTDPFSLFRFR